MEIWDAYDKNMNRVEGVELVRGEAIPTGLYHLVCEIAVRHTDGDYLLMQRDLNKPLGGKWELSAGGSALKGETALAAAKRELFEETGVTAFDITELGRIIHHLHRTIYVEYLCITNCEKNSITLQIGETVAYKWVKREKLDAIRKEEFATVRMQQFIENLE